MFLIGINSYKSLLNTCCNPELKRLIHSSDTQQEVSTFTSWISHMLFFTLTILLVAWHCSAYLK